MVEAVRKTSSLSTGWEKPLTAVNITWRNSGDAFGIDVGVALVIDNDKACVDYLREADRDRSDRATSENKEK